MDWGRGDPSTAFDASGNAYIASMGPNANDSPDGWMIQKSSNLGVNWTNSVRATGPTPGFDKEMISADNSSNSPYINNVYGAWTEFIGGNPYLSYAAVKMNKSTDGGQTFTSPITIRQSNNGTGGGQGACVATSKTGTIYICWADYSSGAFPADGIGFAKSTNGGNNFTSNVPFSYQGTRYPGVDPRFNNTRVNDFPSIAVDKSDGIYAGRIYIAYPNGGNNQSDQSVIQIRYSTNEGASWSGAQTISISYGRQNWFPWVTVDDLTGDISVIYYSLDQATGFATNSYVAHSSDGGSTWENIKVSDVSHITAPIPGFGGGYAGDYIGICAYGGKTYPVWADDRNGTWQLYTSPISYQFSGSVIVKQDYIDGSPVTGSTIGRWNGSLFSSINPGSTINVEGGTTEILKGDQALYNSQKYEVWKKLNDPENDVTNHHIFAITFGFPNQITSQFDHTYYSNIRIKNALEGTSLTAGSIKFSDPWYIDFQDGAYGNSWRNRGMEEPRQFYPRSVGTDGWHPDFTTVYPESPYPYNGVFLNQSYTGTNPVYYSVQAISPQPIALDPIGTRDFYFNKWTADPSNGASFQSATSLTSAVVFNSDGVTVTANLKGQGLSNEQNAYSNSQRKFVQDLDGDYLFNTYSSLSKAWAEKAPNSTNWQLFDGGTQLNSNVAKGVTLDYSQTYVGQDLANLLLVVFQEKVGISSYIKVLCYTNYTPFSNPPVGWRLEDTKDFFVTNDYDNLDCTPVVAFYGSQFKIVIKKSDGLWFLNGDVTHYSTDNKFHISFNSSLAHITGTNSNSVNPSIAAAKNWSNYVQLVWQEDNTIKYIESITPNPTIQTISSGYGYNGNANPSIVVLGDGHGRVCWRASYCRIQADDEVETQNPLCNPRVVFRGTNYSHFWVFGYNTGSPNINKSDDDTYYAIAWSQYDGDSTYFADNSLSTIRSIGIPGKYVQVSNGATKNQMYAEIFNLQTTPYSFTTSNSLGSYYIPRKILSYSFASGRKGVIHKGDAQFFFTVGDIVVDGQPVDFVTIPDTLDVNTKGLMNQYLKTETFQLTDNSNFLYSVEYGITDSLAAVNLFANTNKQVTFELQLIDAQTSEVLASYDEITYDQSNLPIYNNYSYEVNVQGIGSRTVYLRLKVNNNFNPDYALGELYAIGSTLQKSTVKHRDFSNDGIVTVYDLYQNYPNPWNPTTTINYQLPQTGHVILKVYDILGKEVATLVNEQKNQGRYSVNLDGSRLASGVYIYRLSVNDYVSSKKMLLLK